MFKLCELCAPVAVTLASSGTGTKVGTLVTTAAATQLTNCHIFFSTCLQTFRLRRSRSSIRLLSLSVSISFFCSLYSVAVAALGSSGCLGCLDSLDCSGCLARCHVHKLLLINVRNF